MAELLAVPLKKSNDVDIVKPLRNLIQATYSGSEPAEDFGEALAELARLRTSAIWKVFDKTSLDPLYSYHDQLVNLESKIPANEIQISFKWKDAFDKGSLFGGRMSLTLNSLSFELVCIQFNIGALQSCLAAQETLDTEESLKAATKLLQQSAGVFWSLRGAAAAAAGAGGADPTPDLQADTLAALAALQLAQAQELLAYKCMRDEMKDSMVAKVCAWAEEAYTEALRGLQRDSVKHLWDRDWIPTVQRKAEQLGGVAQLYVARECAAGGRPGEAVARARRAGAALRGAAGGASGGAGGAARGPLAEQAARAHKLLQQVERDNDFIYHDRIPTAEDLEPIPKLQVAKMLPPPQRWTDAKDLFARLVPLAQQQARAASEAHRAAAVGREVAALRDATQLLNTCLTSLSLPACVEQCGESELPGSVRRGAAALRAAGGAAGLGALRRELPALLQRNQEILDETERLLREEAEADAGLRAQFGARWSRAASTTLAAPLVAAAAKYRQIIDSAVSADTTVQDKYNQHKEQIELLSGPESELVSRLPAGAAGGAGGAAAGALRALVAQLDQLREERAQIEKELKEVSLEGSLEGAEAERALEAALAPLRARAAASLARQGRLLEEVQSAHAALSAGGGGAGAREAALARLGAAVEAYQDLTNNLQEGIKFYNDLTQLLVAFQNKVSDFCFARRTEKEELLKDLTQESSRAPPQAPQPPSQPPQPPQPARAAPAAPHQHANEIPNRAATLPYPLQPQGMPLPAGAVVLAPPLPAAYNPYATLPYPHAAPPAQYPHAAPPAQYPHAAPPAQYYYPYQYPPQAGPGAPPPGYNPYQQPPHQ